MRQIIVIPSIDGAISIPSQMCPSSVRISPDSPDPQPTSRMNEGISGLMLVQIARIPTAIQEDL